MKNDFLQTLSKGLSQDAKKLLSEILPKETDKYISRIEKDAITFDYENEKFVARRKDDTVIVSYYKNNYAVTEYIKDGKNPIYSYIKIINGEKNTNYSVGYAKIENDKITSSGVANIIYNNEVIEKYEDLNKIAEVTDNDYFTKLSMVVGVLSAKEYIYPEYSILTTYCPTVIGDEKLVLGIDKFLNLIDKKLPDNLKEHLEAQQKIVLGNADVNKLSALSENNLKTEAKFSSTLDTVKELSKKENYRKTI